MAKSFYACGSAHSLCQESPSKTKKKIDQNRSCSCDYARGRFSGSRVYGDDASTIERSIAIGGRGQYSQGAEAAFSEST